MEDAPGAVPELRVCAWQRAGCAGSGWGVSPPIAALSFPQGSPRAGLLRPQAGRHQRAELLHRSGVPAGSLCPLEGISCRARCPGRRAPAAVVPTSPAASWHAFHPSSSWCPQSCCRLRLRANATCPRPVQGPLRTCGGCPLSHCSLSPGLVLYLTMRPRESQLLEINMTVK